MPRTKHGDPKDLMTIRIEGDLKEALREFTGKDPITGRNISLAVLVHNAFLNPDDSMTKDVRDRYIQRQLERTEDQLRKGI